MKPGILEFIEQDAEIWQVVEQFAQLHDKDVSQEDVARLYAALAKAEVAWRARIVRKPQTQPVASAARSRGMP